MLDCCPIYVPIHEGAIFKHVMDIVFVDPIPYRQFVGKLLYILCMHRNIAYFVNVICRYMQAFEVAHLQAMLSILHCLHCYLSYGIYYIKGEENTLHGVTLKLILL